MRSGPRLVVLLCFQSLQVRENDISRRDDVAFNQAHQAGPVLLETECQYFLVLGLGDSRKTLLFPSKNPIAVQIVAGAAHLVEEERSIGAPIDQRMEFG